MLGKLKAMITAAQLADSSVYPVKGCMLRFQGAGAANPSVLTSYNCSVARNAAGVYRVTLAASTAFGVSISTHGVKTLSHLIAPIAATDLFDAQVTIVSATVFDIKTYSIIQGAGTTLTRAAYDIIAGDFIDFSILVNAGSGVLPVG